MVYHDGNLVSPFNFDGVIDEVSVWNRALSESEILELYNSKLGKDACLLGITDLPEPGEAYWADFGHNRFKNNAGIYRDTPVRLYARTEFSEGEIVDLRVDKELLLGDEEGVKTFLDVEVLANGVIDQEWFLNDAELALIGLGENDEATLYFNILSLGTVYDVSDNLIVVSGAEDPAPDYVCTDDGNGIECDRIFVELPFFGTGNLVITAIVIVILYFLIFRTRLLDRLSGKK